MDFFSAFFRFFSLFSAFFCFTFFASLRFSKFCFEANQSEAKFKSIFLVFFAFFTFFHFFSLNFRFASIFSLNFRLFYLRFRFRFLVFHIEVNHVKSGFFFASKRSEIFASISNFASEAKVRAHPIPDRNLLFLTRMSVTKRQFVEPGNTKKGGGVTPNKKLQVLGLFPPFRV